MAGHLPIVFVTDYGREDAYAGALVGAALRVDPHAMCVEGTHGVAAGDVLAGAYHLKSLALAFEPGVVLCAVVDPGVGTDRRAIAIRAGDVLCVAPDNGLVSYIWQEVSEELRGAVQLDVPVDAAPTFHGRDLFAPMAAQLAVGAGLWDCGSEITDPVILDGAFASRGGSTVTGSVLLVDHFGNVVTSIRQRDLDGMHVLSATWEGGVTSRVVSTYAEIADGELALLLGSAGHLEIAARSASARLAGVSPGDAVVVELG